VELFKNLGTILTNQISIQEELKVNWIQGISLIIRRRMFYLPVNYPKI
jgi:hypothetical protein